MQDQHQQVIRRIPLGVVAGVSAAVLAAGGGAAWFAWNSNNNVSSTNTPAPTTSPAPSKLAQSGNEQKAQVYWLNTVNNKVEVVPSAIALNNAGSKDEIIKSAFNRLLAGPTDSALTTTIPTGTKLRNLTVDPNGVRVDLSKEFTEGGGSASMTGRVAQVLYTASTLDPKAKVWISVEGKPLEVLGGEGLMLDQPMTRESFNQNFPL
ncbi:MAG TPA: GerMN domain-containing protein [Chroococcales cyanobacterium]|jgi:spore germination protein GerM